MSNSHFTPTNFCRPSQPHVIILTDKIFTSMIVRPMPLNIDNGLPGILIKIVQNSSSILPNVLTHIYTCALMNTENLLLHQWIIKMHPACVAVNTQFDDENNEFQPIQLQVAINNSKNPNQFDAGRLTVIFKYYSPYTSEDFQIIFLSFGLNANVSVRSIIWLSTLRQWSCHIKLCGNRMVYLFLKLLFILVLWHTKSGLP